MGTSGLIIQAYSFSKENPQAIELQVKNLLDFNKKNNGDLLFALNHYLEILDNADPILIDFMSDHEKNELLRNLQVTSLLLAAQKAYEERFQKEENKKSYNRKITKCNELIDFILKKEEEVSPTSTQPTPNPSAHPIRSATDGFPGKYLALSFGKWLSKQMVEMADHKTKSIRGVMDSVNERRLYWIWSSTLVSTTLDLLPSDFFNTNQASKAVSLPNLYTGYLSWVLYYSRFALNLGLLLKHTIRGPWMTSQEERDIPWTVRFQTQWDLRKFTLLNDSLWATCNILSFFILTGSGALGTWGNVLTIALLVFDVSMALWSFAEQETKYNKEINDYNEKILELQDTLSKPPSAEIKKEIEIQLNALTKAKSKCEKEWRYAKISLKNDISYAFRLLFSFILLSTPFMPLGASALLAINVSGAVLSFACSVLYYSYSGGALEVQKAQDSKKETNMQIDDLKSSMLSEKIDKKKKYIYLEIKTLQAESEYQQQMVQLQTMLLVRSVLFDALLPSIIIVNFVFLPLSMGFAMLGATIALAILSKILIETNFKPNKEALNKFDETEYMQFYHKTEKEHGSQFFTTKGSSPSKKTTLELTQKQAPGQTE